jgi:hypothetical protein
LRKEAGSTRRRDYPGVIRADDFDKMPALKAERFKYWCWRLVRFGFLFSLLSAVAIGADANEFLDRIPEGYFLHSYDDCGVEGRQPHIQMQDCYLWTFNTSDTDAGPKERSAVFSYKGIRAAYTNLNPNLSYVLALTYASDHVYNRVQSLEADGVQLHGPYALPKAKAVRLIVRVPPEVTRDGHMALAWKIHGEVNATVSIVELWANAPASNGLQVASIAGWWNSLEGKVLDIAYDPVTNAQVTLSRRNAGTAISTNTATDGTFSFARRAVEQLSEGQEIEIRAEQNGAIGYAQVAISNLFFEPVHFRPVPLKTAGTKENTLLLDGTWSIDPRPNGDVRARPLGDTTWKPFQVPGQWLQQGFVISPSNSVAAAREFEIPKAWAGKRIILRFDAIHAGAHYWLNGRPIGYSENLFTPVECDVTDAALPGQTNRLDLELKTGTVSEALSYSSAYAFHDLGGIDRSVRIFALPPTYIRELRVNAGLDRDYRDGELQVHLALCGNVPSNDLSVAVALHDAGGKLIRTIREIGAFEGRKEIEIPDRISSPLQWSAEKPNLYRLTVEVRQGKTLLESVERAIGFRRIEIRDRQLYVNGRRIKLAGACHHEFDPLTGRAGTMRHAETDVRLLKEANLNLIRTSHYPPTRELLDAADRIGMYVEAEAPFCWVGGELDTSANLQATLIPTSAMVDYDHAHPSVIFWSLANESHFNPQFQASARMCKQLDPARPTTFNHDFANSPLAMATDIANIHYPSWPFEKVGGSDPRPLYFGEFFFPVCHEQTDVQIDPGLRELWGQGCAEPDSDFSRACVADFERPPLKPGIKPGGWSAIVDSSRLIGGSIWASHDDAFYFSATNHAGYAWHHGFWGLIDCWRRPKPEWFITRHVFSPVWLETRHVPFASGQQIVRVPVENRYSFTDFSELDFRCEVGGTDVRIRPRLAPGTRGYFDIPVPSGTAPGSVLKLRVTNGKTVVHESLVTLGKALAELPKQPAPACAPACSEQEGKILVRGDHFAFLFDRATGDFDARDPRHRSPVIAFPSLHLTRYDFGDLNGPNSPPYAVFPKAASRRVERVEVKEETAGLRLTVYDRYEDFSGHISWLISRNGAGTVSLNYTYSGKPMDTRESGIRFELDPACDELNWRRWSEWGVFPPESILRTAGTARAHRDQRFKTAQWNRAPEWPWALDETELGTADFRSVKFNIYDAGLHSRSGAGLSAHAHADAHFRAALSTNGVMAYVLRRCPLGQVQIKSGEHLKDQFEVQLDSPRRE